MPKYPDAIKRFENYGSSLIDLTKMSISAGLHRKHDLFYD